MSCRNVLFTPKSREQRTRWGLPNDFGSRKLVKFYTVSELHVLTLICPFCQHGHIDDLECLDCGRPDELHCENEQCRKDFAFLVRECFACGEESVFTWTRTPTPETLAMLSCQHCGALFDEAARQSESQSPTQRL